MRMLSPSLRDALPCTASTTDPRRTKVRFTLPLSTTHQPCASRSTAQCTLRVMSCCGSGSSATSLNCSNRPMVTRSLASSTLNCWPSGPETSRNGSSLSTAYLASSLLETRAEASSLTSLHSTPAPTVQSAQECFSSSKIYNVDVLLAMVMGWKLNGEMISLSGVRTIVAPGGWPERPQ